MRRKGVFGSRVREEVGRGGSRRMRVRNGKEGNGRRMGIGKGKKREG